MEITYHDRALLALDVLKPKERNAIRHALDGLAESADVGGTKLRAIPQIEGGEYYALTVPHDLRLVLPKAGESPLRLEVRDVIRLETLKTYARAYGHAV